MLQIGAIKMPMRRLALWMLLLLPAVLLAPNALSAAISQGYSSDKTIPAGSLVSLKDTKGDAIVPANSDNADNLLGVVVPGAETTVNLTSANAKIQVATSGQAQIFVSNLNGPIKAGDSITASPIDGVGMKALDSGKVIGIAQADYNGGGTKAQVKARNGQTQDTEVGNIPVEVQVTYFVPATSRSPVPAYLQRFGNAIGGKQVPVSRLVIAGILMTGALATVAVILFSAVRSSIVSIGRNPLAQGDIYKGLLQVLLTAVGISGVALAGAYFVLVT